MVTCTHFQTLFCQGNGKEKCSQFSKHRYSEANRSILDWPRKQNKDNFSVIYSDYNVVFRRHL